MIYAKIQNASNLIQWIHWYS